MNQNNQNSNWKKLLGFRNLQENLEFFSSFQVPKDYTAEKHDLVDLAVTGHIIHGNGMKSGDFKTFLAQYPEWSYPVGWTASYKSFVF